MLKRFLPILLLLPSTALAQPTPPPEVQACQSKLFETITRELDVRTQLFAVTAELNKVKATLEAKEKSEQKNKPADKPK